MAKKTPRGKVRLWQQQNSSTRYFKFQIPTSRSYFKRASRVSPKKVKPSIPPNLSWTRWGGHKHSKWWTRGISDHHTRGGIEHVNSAERVTKKKTWVRILKASLTRIQGSAGFERFLKEEKTTNDATVLFANVSFCISRSELKTLPRKNEWKHLLRHRRCNERKTIYIQHKT